MAKILIIDDEKSIRDNLKTLLDLDDHETFIASNGSEGLKVFYENHPEIIILDMKMPGMNGIEVLKKIKTESKETEVIMITAHGGLDTAIEAMKEGAFHYLPKPIEYQELEIEIDKALEKQRMQKDLDEYLHRLEVTLEDNAKELSLRKKAEEALKYQIVIEKITASISTVFLKLEIDELDNGINQTLEKIGKFIRADRSYVFLITNKGQKLDNTHEWCADGIKNQMDRIKELSFESFPWLKEKIERFEIIHIPSVANLPPEARLEKKEFQIQSIQSLLCVPMISENRLVGFLGLDAVQQENKWSDTEITLLNIIGNIIVYAMERKRSKEIVESQQQQLIQADKMVSLGTMAAGVAHEINNPLSVAIGDTHLFQRDFKDLLKLINQFSKLPLSPEISKEVERLKSEMDLPYLIENVDKKLSRFTGAMYRVKGIVKQLKEFSHLDRRDLVLIDINKSIQNTLQMIPPKYRHGVEVKTEFEPLPQIECYGRQINQVFMSIILNALQAMRNKGKLRIKTSSEGNHVYIKFCDTGTGIVKDKIKQIFNPFFTTKKVGEGAGLGLSISYSIVKKHGGEITVANNPDKGVTFTVKLLEEGLR